jgi:hypothetical protein
MIESWRTRLRIKVASTCSQIELPPKAVIAQSQASRESYREQSSTPALWDQRTGNRACNFNHLPVPRPSALLHAANATESDVGYHVEWNSHSDPP